MDIVGRICELLDKKKRLFLEYEEATQALLGCGADDAEQYITLRGIKANEIDALTEDVARLCSEAPAAAVLLATANGRAEFQKVPGEYHPVFYAAQAVSSVIQRILQTDTQAMDHLVQLRGEAKNAIRQNQNLPKIKKYLTGLSPDTFAGSLRDGKA